MPYAIKKVRNKSCYKVYNKKTKKVFAKCSTKVQAQKQLRLLRAIIYNKTFVPYGRQNSRKTMKRKL